MSTIVEIRHLGRHAGTRVTVRGWVQTTRTHGRVAFAVVRDGTGIVQCVVVQKQVPAEAWELFQTLTQETSVHVGGVPG